MIALPNAAVIMHDYLEAFGENRDLIAPKRAITAETGDEEDRESNPMSLVVKLTIADRDARHGMRVRFNRGVGGYAEVLRSCQTPLGEEQPCGRRIGPRSR